jgi:CheY-like chemotaxis protein
MIKKIMAESNLIILMADDDEEDLELIEDAILFFEPLANVRKHSNGKEVIESLRSCEDKDLPCLIILDYNMPELTGSQVLLHMSKNDRYENIPKVVLSTSSTAVHIHECMSNGASEYFVKPNDMNALKNVAKKMLDYCRNK